MYSAANLRFAVDCFHLHLFLWTFLALRSSWWVFGPCFSLGFPPYGPLGMDSKNGHQHCFERNLICLLFFLVSFNLFIGLQVLMQNFRANSLRCVKNIGPYADKVATISENGLQI